MARLQLQSPRGASFEAAASTGFQSVREQGSVSYSEAGGSPGGGGLRRGTVRTASDVRKPKRANRKGLRDLNQLAASIVGDATGDADMAGA